MSASRSARLLPWTGPLFAILFVVFSFVVDQNTPSDKAKGEEVVAYYHSHQGGTIVGALATPLGAVLFLLFYSHLRSIARARGAKGVGPTLMVGGGILFGAALMAQASIDIALAGAGWHHQVQVAETMNVLSNSTWIPFIGGTAIALIGAGATILTAKILPTWMGWIALVAGIVSLVGPGGFIGFFASPLFALVGGLILALRKSDAPAAAG